MGRTVEQQDQRSDAVLIAATRAGDPEAFAVLYDRHQRAALSAASALGLRRADAEDVVGDAFSRVLAAIQQGGGPEVAFRPYLLTAVRNACYDRSRRRRDELPGDMLDIPADPGSDDPDRRADAAMAAAAYATLPERWQMVLWHTEVEGLSASEVAPLLGIAPNAVAALAYRAREGLRQAYLQAHLRVQDDLDCRRCTEQLGAYVRDGLSSRDRERVEQHLSGCSSCRSLLAEVRDTNATLRAALIPAVVGVPVGAYTLGATSGGVLARLALWPRAGAVAATCAACVCGAAVVGVVVLDDDHADPDVRVVVETPAEVAAGDLLQVTVSVANVGDEPLDPVTVSLPVPPGTEVESIGGGSCDASARCVLGPLAEGGTVAATIGLRVSAGAPPSFVLEPSVLEPADVRAEVSPVEVAVVDTAAASASA